VINDQVNTAILERLEKVVESLQDNSVKMGQLLAVHNEKLDKQDRIDAVLFDKVEELRTEFHAEADIIKKGCERDIRLIDVRLRTLEKKMWSIAGSLAVISVLVSPIGQRMVGALTGQTSSAIVNPK
jgi:transcription elongation GreA/GreB family factor|tara:strand:- start:1646 stop:2026 length:381 start_codon:yes stop_codon:yes gene_type:complete